MEVHGVPGCPPGPLLCPHVPLATSTTAPSWAVLSPGLLWAGGASSRAPTPGHAPSPKANPEGWRRDGDPHTRFWGPQGCGLPGTGPCPPAGSFPSSNPREKYRSGKTGECLTLFPPSHVKAKPERPGKIFNNWFWQEEANQSFS